MKVLYSWLQEEYFDGKLPGVHEVAESLLLHSFEIEGVQELDNDAVIDIDVLPNRAHDCLSHRGIAKELSIILGIPLSEKGIESNFNSVNTNLEIDVKEKNLCNRYMGRVLKNIEIKDSPSWLKERLEVLGQKSINSLVDLTNYVLLDIGQPTHVFDLDKLKSPSIEVQKGHREEVETLDGKKVELLKEDLVIASGKEVLAVAGIKGGKRAEVTTNTKNIVLESAHFDPVSVRKTSRRLSIMTDSSKRFENEPTSELAAEAMEYLTRLIVSTCGTGETIVENVVDQYQRKEKVEKVKFETSHVNKLLGTDLADQEVADVLNRFGWDYQKVGEEFDVEIPKERLDLRNSADLVEEIGRIYGYKNVPEKELPAISNVSFNKEFYYTKAIKDQLIREGFSEVYTQSFKPEGKLKMANPVAEDRPYLRENIDLGSIFEMNVRNKDLLGLDEVKIFEIGKVFDDKANEELVLSIKSENTIQSDLLNKFNIKISGKEAQINLDSIIEKLPEINSYDEIKIGEVKKYQEFSKYPFIVRDIAVWLPKPTAKEGLVELIKENGGELLVREPRLVDQYSKDDRVSYAYRLIFQSYNKTLTDTEIADVMNKIESAVSKKGWEVR